MQREHRPPPEVLTEDEIRLLLRACSVKAPTGVRNRALIVVLYRGGLRLGEALALKPMDLDLIEHQRRPLHHSLVVLDRVVEVIEPTRIAARIREPVRRAVPGRIRQGTLAAPVEI